MKGDVLGANIAALNAATIVRGSTKSIDDDFMRDSIDSLQKNAIKEITQFGYDSIRTKPAEVKQFSSVSQETDRSLKIGDIIKVPAESGGFTYSIYTGTKDANHYITLYTGQ